MKYLIDSEVCEEISEMLSLQGVINNDEVIICCSEDIFEQLSIGEYKTYRYTKNRSRIITKIKQFILLVYVVCMHRPDVIFSGYPLLKHRLISLLYPGRLRHYSYLRGLFADPLNYKGFSDRLYLKIKRWPTLLKFNNFQCDRIYTVSEINVDFLRARSVQQRIIELIPPPWLDKIAKQREKQVYAIKKNSDFYFVTQAFAAHSSEAASESQLEFALKLRIELNKKNLNLIIRKHPRDNIDYEKYGFLVNSIPSYEFLVSLNSNDCLISPFSTMAFEASYFNIAIIFYTTPELDSLYARVYDRLKVVPVTTAEEISSKLLELPKIGMPNAELNDMFFKRK